MSKPLAIAFTNDFFSCGILQQGEVKLLEAEGFKLIPLYFEVRNGELVYLVEKEVFQFGQSQQHIIYGDFFERIEKNDHYLLHGSSLDVVNLLTLPLETIRQKYYQLTGSSQQTVIPVILSLPEGISSKVTERVMLFLKSRRFEIIGREQFAAVFLQNNPDVVLLNSLGESSIFLQRVLPGGNFEHEKILTFDDRKTREELARMMVDNALSRSSTNSTEKERTDTYRKYVQKAATWLYELRKSPEVSEEIRFPDGYPAVGTVLRSELDKISMDSMRVIHRLKLLNEQKPLQRIFLLGEKMQNSVLNDLLIQHFGDGKIVRMFGDEGNMKEVLLTFLKKKQTEREQQAEKEIRKVLRGWLEKQEWQIKEEQQQQLEAMAADVEMLPETLQRIMAQESAKIIFTGIESLSDENATMLLKARHREKGTVIVKVLKTKFQQDGSEKLRINKDYEQFSEFIHPNIAKITGRSAPGDEATYYLTEFLEGNKLSKLVPINDEETIAAYSLAILSALHYIHSRTVWHRGLKAGNLFVGNPDQPGIAPVKLTLSGLERTDDIETKKKQNIREFGIILLQMFTGNTDTHALAQVRDKRWASVIKHTNGGSPAAPYRDVKNIIEDIERIVADNKSKIAGEGDTGQKSPFSLLRWIIATAVIALLIAAAFFGRDYLKKDFFKNVKAPQLQKTDAGNALFERTYVGTIKDHAGRDMVYSLQILNTEQKGSKLYIEYTLRVDTIGTRNRFYEKNRKGEIFLEQNLINLGGVLGEVEFYRNSLNKIILKPRRFQDLELK